MQRTLEHADRIFTYTDQQISMPRSVTKQLLEVLERWEKIFPKEDTHISREYGVPSLIVRFDGVLTPEGTFNIYELQSGCGWVGYTKMVNDSFAATLAEYRSSVWPEFKLLTSPQVITHPDELFWMERVKLEETLEHDYPLWVRCPYWELPIETREKIIARSLKPVYTHNRKRYGVAFGWWKPVGWRESDHGASLPWDEPFVLKPTRGFGGTDVMLWNPKERSGRATRTQIVHALQKRDWMYMQAFIPPMRTDIDGGDYNVILRPFFGYDTKQRTWVPMHGIWTGRPYPNLRIHGASDSISGPLYMEGV